MTAGKLITEAASTRTSAPGNAGKPKLAKTVPMLPSRNQRTICSSVGPCFSGIGAFRLPISIPKIFAIAAKIGQYKQLAVKESLVFLGDVLGYQYICSVKVRVFVFMM
jgi:hypothetical protein